MKSAILLKGLFKTDEYANENSNEHISKDINKEVNININDIANADEKGFIDLHTHSIFSDGTLTPTQLVKKAKEKGLAAIALTDHDTVDGLEEAIEAGKKYGVEVICGIEFSVKSDTEMHLLGLDFSLDCPEIKRVLSDMIKNREERNFKVIEKLSEIGIKITHDDIIRESTSKVTGRSQIAKAMVKKGYEKSINEAFERYLSIGRPAFVTRKTLSAEKAIEIIKKSGGKSSLAHLNQIGKTNDELYEILSRLKQCGLDAVEGYYTEYTDEMNAFCKKAAADLGLAFSGGSDFHGDNKINHELGTGAGNLKIPYSVLEKLRKKII